MSYLTEIKEVSPEIQAINRELEEMLKKQVSRVKIIGIGGAGGNSISRMKEVGIKGGEIIGVNTDAQDLLYTAADKKILIGKQISKGLGAGSDPQIGMEAARESAKDLRDKIGDSDMVFITCGLGGGTGTGAAPIVADIVKKQGALTIAVVTLPFTVEGKKRVENAMEGLEKLKENVDTLIVIPNDKLLEIAPELPMSTAFRVADEILTNAIKGVTELVTSSGLVNLDFADLKAVMSNGGLSLIGLGESDGVDRAVESVERAITNPLLDVDITDATGALINVMGGEDLSLEEYKKIMEYLGERLSPDAKIISGARISKELSGILKVMVIVTGINPSRISKKENPQEEDNYNFEKNDKKEKKKNSNEEEIELIEDTEYL
jgi:cell division protein FtsZ